MARKKATTRTAARARLVKATFSIAPDQLAAVVAEARRRALQRGTARADAGQVVREALDQWMKRTPVEIVVVQPQRQPTQVVAIVQRKRTRK
jgi:hypothetical protein